MVKIFDLLWVNIREKVIKKQQNACALCLHATKKGSEVIYRIAEVHHIIPMSEGGGNDFWNLIGLCWSHHREQHKAKPKSEPIKPKFVEIDYLVVEGTLTKRPSLWSFDVS
jgi:5-methylcytosine-specific restriction endonuclease McrA